jgi:aryl-alcohol dehydrogenase-like predicted oxidoreductase
VTTAARSVALASGERIAALGQGTWHFAEHPARRADEIASVRLGLDLGLTLVDTAEMYADGAATGSPRSRARGPRPRPENAAALRIRLGDEDLTALDSAFPADPAPSPRDALGSCR